ncbi:MAG: M48 family metalloprotease [Acidimicrobiia bacterium]
MGFVLRRSLPSLTGLVGLLLAVGVAAVVFAGAPVWFPAAFAIAMLLVQYVVNPWIVEWLVPAHVIEHDGERYLTDHVVGEIVARRCREAGIPLVRLGIVDDGTPNAFTFGRRRGDARIWLTRGLFERLDEAELDAVVTHEIGHIKHLDFVVMTVAAVIPMVLYLTYILMRGQRGQAQAVALGAFVAYLVSSFTILALSRARELAADHWSCRCTGNGDALASALVKIAYGMGKADAELRNEAAALRAQGAKGKVKAAKVERHARRAQSMRAMGIFEPRTADAMATAFAHGIDPNRALAAMRWDSANPWARLLEKLSTHPLVAHRIQELDESGLPGRPTTWSVLRSEAAAVSRPERAALRVRFTRELAVSVAPWIILLSMLFAGAFTSSLPVTGTALLAAGALLLWKQSIRYPDRFEPVESVTGLLDRLDAGPVAGIPVLLHGRVMGRGMPGYVLSPDLVVEDAGGFVPVLYRQPIPFAGQLFGLLRARAFLGQEVSVQGWYRRGPQPSVELKCVYAADGRRARAGMWIAHWLGSALVLAAGGAVLMLGLGQG